MLVAENAHLLSTNGGAGWRFYHEDCQFNEVPEEQAGADYLTWSAADQDLVINHAPGAKSEPIVEGEMSEEIKKWLCGMTERMLTSIAEHAADDVDGRPDMPDSDDGECKWVIVFDPIDPAKVGGKLTRPIAWGPYHSRSDAEEVLANSLAELPRARIIIVYPDSAVDIPEWQE